MQYLDKAYISDNAKADLFTHRPQNNHLIACIRTG